MQEASGGVREALGTGVLEMFREASSKRRESLRSLEKAGNLREASRKLPESVRSLQNACRKLAGSVSEALEAGGSFTQACRKLAQPPERVQEACGKRP